MNCKTHIISLMTNTEKNDFNATIGNTVLPAVFLSGEDKAEQFKKELKGLLAKYDAELAIEDFGKEWSPDEKIVVNFSWDEDLAKRTNSGNVPYWIVGRWENERVDYVKRLCDAVPKDNKNLY